MSLTNSTINFAYDHPTYTGRGSFSAIAAAGANLATTKFVAHANLQLMSVSVNVTTAGTSTYTKSQYYPNGSGSVHVAVSQYTVYRIYNTAAAGVAVSLATATLAQFSPDILYANGTGTGAAGQSYIQALNTGTGSAGLYGYSVNQGDVIQVLRGTDATEASVITLDYNIQPLANVIG